MIYLRKNRSPNRSLPESPTLIRESNRKSRPSPDQISNVGELLLRIALSLIACGLLLLSPILLFASGFLASIAFGVFTLCSGLFAYIVIVLMSIFVICCLPFVGIILLTLQCNIWWNEWQRSRLPNNEKERLGKNQNDTFRQSKSIENRRNLSYLSKKKAVTWFDQTKDD